MKKLIFCFPVVYVLVSGCAPSIYLSSIPNLATFNDSLTSIVICRADGADMNLNNEIASRLELVLNQYIDSVINHEIVNNQLQKEGIFQFDNYSEFLIQKISKITNQKYILVPKIVNLKRSQNIDVNASATIHYCLFDSSFRIPIFTVIASIKDRTVSNSNFQYPTDINREILKATNSASIKILEFLNTEKYRLKLKLLGEQNRIKSKKTISKKAKAKTNDDLYE